MNRQKPKYRDPRTGTYRDVQQGDTLPSWHSIIFVVLCAVLVILLVTCSARAQELATDEEIARQERDLRDAYDARRAAAFAAGDTVAHRGWLLRLRMIEGAITARELQRLVDRLLAEDDAPAAAEPEPADPAVDRPGYRTHDATDYSGWTVVDGQTFTGRPGEGARCRRSRTLYINCTFEANGTGFWAQPDGDARLNDIHLVNCIIKNNWRGNYASHSHGAYIERVDGLLVEDCVFEGNGWPNQGTRPDYGLNHHLYISLSNDVTVRGCVFADGLYHAVKIRNSTYTSERLYIEGNAFITTPAPLAFSMNAADKPGGIIYRDIEVWGNVFAATPAWPPVGNSRATRLIEVNNADGVRVHDNLFAEGTSPGSEEAVHVHPWGPNLDARIDHNTSELTPFPAGPYTNANGYKLTPDDPELTIAENTTRPATGRTWTDYPGDRTDAAAIITYYRAAQASTIYSIDPADGTAPAKIVYSHQLYDHGRLDTTRQPPADKIEAVMLGESAGPVLLDFEAPSHPVAGNAHHPNITDADVAAAQARVAQIIASMRQLQPRGVFVCYGTPGLLSSSVDGVDRDWTRLLDSPLAEAVDGWAVTGYHYGDVSQMVGWGETVTRTVEAAQSTGQPVYVVVNHRHRGEPGGETIPIDVWRDMLAVLRGLGVRVILWQHPDAAMPEAYIAAVKEVFHA